MSLGLGAFRSLQLPVSHVGGLREETRCAPLGLMWWALPSNSSIQYESQKPVRGGLKPQPRFHGSVLTYPKNSNDTIESGFDCLSVLLSNKQFKSRLNCLTAYYDT